MAINRAFLLTPALCLTAAVPALAAASASDLSDLAERLVRAYHAGDVEVLRPHLAQEFGFRDRRLKQRFELVGFLESVASTDAGKGDRELELKWTGVADNIADVRGTLRETDVEGGRTNELAFSIELEFDTAGEEPRVVFWLHDFRRKMWKQARGDKELKTQNFMVVYYQAEFSGEEATRLGKTLEHWYEKTRTYLGRSFAEGFRLRINVAGGHGSPYASDPGPEAFILVSTRSAKRDYGFSMVHELTHNLLGASWLSRHEHEHDGVTRPSGNRLFDEGFAVYVEEQLTGEGPRVFPNFGDETHAGYWRLRVKRGEPISPVLEAELQRQSGDVRLGYLTQGSFCKHLVETAGLDRFLRLYAADPASAEEIYGSDFADLEREWRMFLEERFGG